MNPSRPYLYQPRHHLRSGRPAVQHDAAGVERPQPARPLRALAHTQHQIAYRPHMVRLRCRRFARAASWGCPRGGPVTFGVPAAYVFARFEFLPFSACLALRKLPRAYRLDLFEFLEIKHCNNKKIKTSEK